MEGIPHAMLRIHPYIRSNSSCADKEKTDYLESLNQMAALQMYLFPICVWKILLEIKVDSLSGVGDSYVLFLTWRGFYELWSSFQGKSVPPSCFLQNFTED